MTVLVADQDEYMTAVFVYGPLDGTLLLRYLSGSRTWVVEGGGRGYPMILHPEQEAPGAPHKAEVLRYHDSSGLTHYYMWSYDKTAYVYLTVDDALVPFGSPVGRFPAGEPLPPPPPPKLKYTPFGGQH